MAWLLFHSLPSVDSQGHNEFIVCPPHFYSLVLIPGNSQLNPPNQTLFLKGTISSPCSLKLTAGLLCHGLFSFPHPSPPSLCNCPALPQITLCTQTTPTPMLSQLHPDFLLQRFLQLPASAVRWWPCHTDSPSCLPYVHLPKLRRRGWCFPSAQLLLPDDDFSTLY